MVSTHNLIVFYFAFFFFKFFRLLERKETVKTGGVEDKTLLGEVQAREDGSMHLGGEDGAGVGRVKTADPLAGLCDTLTPGLLC